MKEELISPFGTLFNYWSLIVNNEDGGTCLGFFEAQSSQMSPHPPGYVFRAWSRRPVFCVFCPRHEDPLRLRKSPLSSCINSSLGKQQQQQQQNLIQISFRFSVEGSGVVWVMVGGHWILWIQWIVCVINFRRRKNILHLLNRHFERANYDVTLWSKQKSLLTHHRVCQSTIQPLLRFVFALPPPCTASLASCWRQRRSWRRAAEPRRSPPSPLSTQQNAAMLSGGRSKTLNKDEKIFEEEKG